MNNRPTGVMTLIDIQYLTGHENADAVRMALKRAGVKAVGFIVGGEYWPPRKTYATDDIWRVFGERILRHAETDAEVKKRCWEVFQSHITHSTAAREAHEEFFGNPA